MFPVTLPFATEPLSVPWRRVIPQQQGHSFPINLTARLALSFVSGCCSRDLGCSFAVDDVTMQTRSVEVESESEREEVEDTAKAWRKRRT